MPPHRVLGFAIVCAVTLAMVQPCDARFGAVAVGLFARQKKAAATTDDDSTVGADATSAPAATEGSRETQEVATSKDASPLPEEELQEVEEVPRLTPRRPASAPRSELPVLPPEICQTLLGQLVEPFRFNTQEPRPPESSLAASAVYDTADGFYDADTRRREEQDDERLFADLFISKKKAPPAQDDTGNVFDTHDAHVAAGGHSKHGAVSLPSSSYEEGLIPLDGAVTTRSVVAVIRRGLFKVIRDAHRSARRDRAAKENGGDLEIPLDRVADDLHAGELRPDQKLKAGDERIIGMDVTVGQFNALLRQLSLHVTALVDGLFPTDSSAISVAHSPEGTAEDLKRQPDERSDLSESTSIGVMTWRELLTVNVPQFPVTTRSARQVFEALCTDDEATLRAPDAARRLSEHFATKSPAVRPESKASSHPSNPATTSMASNGLDGRKTAEEETPTPSLSDEEVRHRLNADGHALLDCTFGAPGDGAAQVVPACFVEDIAKSAGLHPKRDWFAPKCAQSFVTAQRSLASLFPTLLAVIALFFIVPMFQLSSAFGAHQATQWPMLSAWPNGCPDGVTSETCNFIDKTFKKVNTHQQAEEYLQEQVVRILWPGVVNLGFIEPTEERRIADGALNTTARTSQGEQKDREKYGVRKGREPKAHKRSHSNRRRKQPQQRDRPFITSAALTTPPWRRPDSSTVAAAHVVSRPPYPSEKDALPKKRNRQDGPSHEVSDVRPTVAETEYTVTRKTALSEPVLDTWLVGALLLRVSPPTDRTNTSVPVIPCGAQNLTQSFRDNFLPRSFSCDSWKNAIIPFNETLADAQAIAKRFTIDVLEQNSDCIAVAQFASFQPNHGILTWTTVSLVIPNGGTALPSITTVPIQYSAWIPALAISVLEAISLLYALIVTVGSFPRNSLAVMGPSRVPQLSTTKTRVTALSYLRFILPHLTLPLATLWISLQAFVLLVTLPVPNDGSLNQGDYVPPVIDTAAANYVMALDLLALWAALLFGLRLPLLLRNVISVGLINRLLHVALGEIVGLTAGFVTVYLAFVGCAMTILGSDERDFASFLAAHRSLFPLFRGGGVSAALTENSPVVGRVLEYAFTIFVVFIAMNLVVAALTAPLNSVREAANLHLEMDAFLKGTIRQLPLSRRVLFKVRRWMLPTLNIVLDSLSFLPQAKAWLKFHRLAANVFDADTLSKMDTKDHERPNRINPFDYCMQVVELHEFLLVSQRTIDKQVAANAAAASRRKLKQQQQRHKSKMTASLAANGRGHPKHQQPFSLNNDDIVNDDVVMSQEDALEVPLTDFAPGHPKAANNSTGRERNHLGDDPNRRNGAVVGGTRDDDHVCSSEEDDDEEELRTSWRTHLVRVVDDRFAENGKKGMPYDQWSMIRLVIEASSPFDIVRDSRLLKILTLYDARVTALHRLDSEMNDARMMNAKSFESAADETTLTWDAISRIARQREEMAASPASPVRLRPTFVDQEVDRFFAKHRKQQRTSTTTTGTSKNEHSGADASSLPTNGNDPSHATLHPYNVGFPSHDTDVNGGPPTATVVPLGVREPTPPPQKASRSYCVSPMMFASSTEQRRRRRLREEERRAIWRSDAEAAMKHKEDKLIMEMIENRHGSDSVYAHKWHSKQTVMLVRSIRRVRFFFVGTFVNLIVYVAMMTPLLASTQNIAYLAYNVHAGLRDAPYRQSCTDDSCSSGFTHTKTFSDQVLRPDVGQYAERLLVPQLFPAVVPGANSTGEATPPGFSRVFWDKYLFRASNITVSQRRVKPSTCEGAIEGHTVIHGAAGCYSEDGDVDKDPMPLPTGAPVMLPPFQNTVPGDDEHNATGYKPGGSRRSASVNTDDSPRDEYSFGTAESSATTLPLPLGAFSYTPCPLGSVEAYFDSLPCGGFTTSVTTREEMLYVFQHWIDAATTSLVLTVSFALDEDTLEYSIVWEFRDDIVSARTRVNPSIPQRLAQFNYIAFVSVASVLGVQLYYLVRSIYFARAGRPDKSRAERPQIPWLEVLVVIAALSAAFLQPVNQFDMDSFLTALCITYVTRSFLYYTMFPVIELFTRRATVVLTTLRITASTLVIVVPYFVVCFGGFGFGMHFYFGTVVDAFSTIGGSLQQVAAGFSGSWPHEELAAERPVAAIIATTTFFIFATALLANIVLALITSSFEEGLAEAQGIAFVDEAVRLSHGTVVGGPLFHCAVAWLVVDSPIVFFLRKRGWFPQLRAGRPPAFRVTEFGRVGLPLEMLGWLPTMAPRMAEEVVEGLQLRHMPPWLQPSLAVTIARKVQQMEREGFLQKQ